MSRLIRVICMMLAVAFLASMTLHGPADAHDQAEHMADELAASHGVEVSGHTHPDCDGDGDDRDDKPTPGHHHHSGTDHSFALSDKAGEVLAVITPEQTKGWPQDRLPDDLAVPGPDQPPKRMRTIV